jgi:hypothetical protein
LEQEPDELVLPCKKYIFYHFYREINHVFFAIGNSGIARHGGFLAKIGGNLKFKNRVTQIRVPTLKTLSTKSHPTVGFFGTNWRKFKK